MTLQDWLSNGWLKQHTTSQQEINELLAGAGQHYRTIQSLRFTINPDSDIIISLEAISKKRAIVSYDAAGRITEGEVEEARQLADQLLEQLKKWLQDLTLA